MKGINPYTMPSTTAPCVFISFNGFSISPKVISRLLMGPLPISRMRQPYMRIRAFVQKGTITSSISTVRQRRGARAMQ